MATTYAVPSGTPLPSQSAPREFTATLPVVHIFARYTPNEGENPRPVETVYADLSGVNAPEFAYPYLDSTKDGNTFTVVRKGGWPRDLTVYVQEATPIPAGGQALARIYEVDLTAQPSQSMATSGSYTIDGKTWWVKGDNGTGGITELVNGSGLRIYQPSTVDTNAWALWRGQGLGTIYKARLLSLALAQLADYNPLAPLAIMWHLTSNRPASDDPIPWAGLGDIVASSATLTPGEKGTCLTVMMPIAASAGYRMTPPYDGGSSYNFSTAYSSATVSNHVTGLYRLMPNRFALLHNATVWAGSMPDLNNMGDVSTTTNVPMSNSPGLSSSPSFIMGIAKGSSGGDLDAYLTHLSVWQPKVAA